METLNRRGSHGSGTPTSFPLQAVVLRLPQGNVALFTSVEALRSAMVRSAGAHGIEVLGNGALPINRAAQLIGNEPVQLNSLVYLGRARRCSLVPVGGQRRLSLLLSAGPRDAQAQVAGDPWYDLLLDITAVLPVWEMRVPETEEQMEATWFEIGMLLAESCA